MSDRFKEQSNCCLCELFTKAEASPGELIVGHDKAVICLNGDLAFSTSVPKNVVRALTGDAKVFNGEDATFVYGVREAPPSYIAPRRPLGKPTGLME